MEKPFQTERSLPVLPTYFFIEIVGIIFFDMVGGVYRRKPKGKETVMALRATGPGLIEIDPRYRGAGILKALLYNFDFDDMNINTLKKEHTDFLRTRAVPLLERNSGRIWLEGT